MQQPRQGITLLGFLSTVVVTIALLLLAMRVVPVYINYFTVINSIKSLNKLPKDELGQSPVRAKIYLRKYLSRQLYLNEVRFIDGKQIDIARERNQYRISINYHVEKKLLGHLYFLFKFHPSYAIPIK